MKQLNFSCTLAIALAAVVIAAPASAADLIAGQQKSEASCVVCHGAQGNKPIDPSYPKLAGQNQDYLVQALNAYKSGARKNPIMGAQASSLSSIEIKNLAAYFASQTDGLKLKK